MAATGTDITDAEIAELAGTLRFLIARLNRQLRQQDNSGLSPSLGAALATIAADGPMTLGALAAAEQVSAPTVTKLVDKLVEQSFVTREVDPSDKRICRVQVTPAGRRRLDAIRTRRTAWLAERLSKLPADSLVHFREAVSVLDALTTPPEPPDAGGSGRS